MARKVGKPIAPDDPYVRAGRQLLYCFWEILKAEKTNAGPAQDAFLYSAGKYLEQALAQLPPKGQSKRAKR